MSIFYVSEKSPTLTRSLHHPPRPHKKEQGEVSNHLICQKEVSCHLEWTRVIWKDKSKLLSVLECTYAFDLVITVNLDLLVLDGL